MASQTLMKVLLMLSHFQEAKRKIPLLNQHISALDAGAVRGLNRIVAEAEMDFTEADGFVSNLLSRSDWVSCMASYWANNLHH